MKSSEEGRGKVACVGLRLELLHRLPEHVAQSEIAEGGSHGER